MKRIVIALALIIYSIVNLLTNGDPYPAVAASFTVLFLAGWVSLDSYEAQVKSILDTMA